MSNQLKNYTFIIAFVLLIISCTKDQTSPTNSIETAKNWYLESNHKSVTRLSSSNTQSVKKLEQLISWDLAKHYVLSDKTEIVVVPSTFKFNDGKNLDGSFLLLISKLNGVYKQYLAYNHQNGDMLISNPHLDVEAIYKNVSVGTNVNRSMMRDPNKNRTMVLDDTCIDWYLTETYYDEYGNETSYYEHFLHTTCESMIDGGGVSREVTNDLTDICKKRALAKIEGLGMNSYISSLYDKFFVGGSPYNIEFQEANDLTVNNNPAMAYTTQPYPSTWRITISSNYFTGSDYNMSQEAWAAIIAHEILHTFINISQPEVQANGYSHAFIFKNYIDSTRDLLVTAFNMNQSTATALALNGLKDMWGLGGFESLQQNIYGKSNAQVQAAYDLYFKGTGGIKC